MKVWVVVSLIRPSSAAEVVVGACNMVVQVLPGSRLPCRRMKHQYLQPNSARGRGLQRDPGQNAKGSATASIRGGWPVASRNLTRSSRASEVVMVLRSGWQLMTL